MLTFVSVKNTINDTLMKTNTEAAKESVSYEQSLTELEAIVKRMESGELTLDALTEGLTRAQQLLTLCRARLRDVEADTQRILASPTP